MLVVELFVAHPYEPPSNAYDVETYRHGVVRLLTAVEEVFKGRGEEVRIKPHFESARHDQSVSAQVLAALAMSDCALVDVTDTAANVMYELGYLTAANAPVTILRSAKSRTPPPSDLDRLIVEYDTVEELATRALAATLSCVDTALTQYRILPSDQELIWFPRDVQSVHIVCPRSPDKLLSAEISHPNFVYLEQFSDKDALLELMVTLSRTYTARIHRYTSRDFPKRQLIRENIVIVGGPGLDGISEGNDLCREMWRRIPSSLRYSPDGETLTVLEGASGAGEYQATYSRDDGLLVDYGYFARFPNPFNPEAVVVMVHGLHTAGVLGAAVAFSERPQSAANFRALRELAEESGVPLAFESFFEVETMAGDVVVPELKLERVFGLDPHHPWTGAPRIG